nr:site-specific DNA-methyltransferase [Candidatus Thiosymbion oneisti]
MRDGEAHCRNIGSGETRRIPVGDLVVVRRFGEPIFPALTPVDKVQNGPEDAPWHTLIEADNYHALQLLEYLYAGQVDCIYIDPPYNTGARDWKYNNDYVDANDNWRHSKWLAMMRRRLKIAVRLLRKDGILCITIDDFEHHHIRTLISSSLNELSYLGTAVVRTSPSGRPSTRGFRVNHEYALFFGKGESASIGRVPISGGQQVFFCETDDKGPFGWQNLRKRGGANTFRKARPKQYFPLYVTADGFRVPAMDWNKETRQWDVRDTPKKGEVEMFPIGDDGRERIWSLSPAKMMDGSEEFEIRENSDGNFVIWRKLRPNPEGSLPSTWWDSDNYSIVAHGASELEQILGRSDRPFPFPKSPFSVVDALRVSGAAKPDALIIDFFAGSGTTLHAVNLLNELDNGVRRCVLVTNNEVSEEESRTLSEQGLHPGNTAWEQHGICQSVTWPRSKYTILGKRDDGSELDGEYLTGKTIEKEKPRKFQQIGFTSIEDLNTAAKKKQLVALIEGIPQSEVKKDSAFVVSEKHPASILFDESQADAWLEALEDQEHIEDFYMVTAGKATFDGLRARIHDLLGPVIVTEEEKRPMREGFAANLEYFRLDFLDKDHVALGRQFREILPLLWLRAGAIGPRPELPANQPLPAMLIPERNPFAVLVDETRFADFAAELDGRDDLTHVFLVTDSEEAFQEMAGELRVPNLIQLYRDYLENFVINKGGDGT